MSGSPYATAGRPSRCERLSVRNELSYFQFLPDGKFLPAVRNPVYLASEETANTAICGNIGILIRRDIYLFYYNNPII